MKKETIKRHAISAGLTFSTGFAIAILAQFDSLTLQSFQNGAWLGVVFAAARSGVKVTIELFVAWRTK